MSPKRIHHPWSLENFNDGYITQGRFRVYLPDHPRAVSRGYVLRSIVAYEAYHGVEVTWGLNVHHIDGNKLNDSAENLELMPRYGKRSHNTHHHSGENNFMWGRTGAKHPRWKGDNASPPTKFMRAMRARRRAIADGILTPEIEAEYERAKIVARPHWAKEAQERRARKQSQGV